MFDILIQQLSTFVDWATTCGNAQVVEEDSDNVLQLWLMSESQK